MLVLRGTNPLTLSLDAVVHDSGPVANLGAIASVTINSEHQLGWLDDITIYAPSLDPNDLAEVTVATTVAAGTAIFGNSTAIEFVAL